MCSSDPHGEQQPAIFADNRDDLSNDNHEVNARDGLGNADDDVPSLTNSLILDKLVNIRSSRFPGRVHLLCQY